MTGSRPLPRSLPRPLHSLSARLLVLTALFVMLAEVLIFAPSLARFRQSWLEQRLAEAELAALALDAAPDGMVTETLERTLLARVGARTITLGRPGGRLTLLSETPPPPSAAAGFDLRTGGAWTLIAEAAGVLAAGEAPRLIRLAGAAPGDPEAEVALILEEAPLRAAMLGFAGRIFGLSLVISLSTAGLVFFSLRWLLVRPLQRITASMAAFRADPESEAAARLPTGRGDELGIAARELAAMQEALRAALRQRTRLAALGSAVARIHHDMGNILATASLISERLGHSADPEVRQIEPRLMSALDRAAALCGQTLSYARDGVLPLRRSRFALAGLAAEIGAEISTAIPLVWVNRLPPQRLIQADRDQLARALLNLGRNAAQAGARTVSLELAAAPPSGRLVLILADDGPGLPEAVRATLFQPFAAGGRNGGCGLGLAIAWEILRAHGGALRLEHTGPAGTRFALELPE
jgi:signal transduction histidine kinase